MKSAFPVAIRRPLAALVLGAALAASLQGCFPLMVGATAVGTLAATDRRTVGAQTEDKSIELKGEGRAKRITGGDGRVAVTSYNRMVLLTGEVKDAAMKAEVQRQIATIDNVRSIENDLVVAPLSSMGARSNDLLITSKVKAAFIDTKDLYVNAFLVHTDRSVVYLMGRVTQREAKLAAEVARNTGGVRKVVTLFEFISEEELSDLQAKPSPDASKDAGAK